MTLKRAFLAAFALLPAIAFMGAVHARAQDAHPPDASNLAGSRNKTPGPAFG